MPRPPLTRDPGLGLLEHLRRALSIDEAWCVDDERAFTWWPHRLAQRVVADAPRRELGADVVRVRSATVVARGVDIEGEVLAKRLDALNRTALASGLCVLDDDTVACVSHIFVHAQNQAWARQVFASTLALQAVIAHEHAEAWATALGGDPAWSAHPEHGPRAEPDEMLTIVDVLYRPHGESAPELAATFEAMARIFASNGCLSNASPTGLAVEFTLDETTAVTCLVMLDIERDPRLGHGVRITMRLPPTDALPVTAATARLLQQREWSGWTQAVGLGGWHVCPNFGTLAYTSFVPALLCREPASMINIVMAQGLRARWALNATGDAG